MSVLHQSLVLVLNRVWQAIDIRTPADTFGLLATNSATALDVRGRDDMRPVTWAEWLRLPVRDGDFSVGTLHGPVRVPTVIVLAKFARVPLIRPALSPRGLWARDGGVCQYTGRRLAPHEGNIDHVVPRSRGGRTTWENCVVADRRVNSRKADRTPEEAGLRLLRPPRAPRAVPVTVRLARMRLRREWEWFLQA